MGLELGSIMVPLLLLLNAALCAREGVAIPAGESREGDEIKNPKHFSAMHLIDFICRLSFHISHPSRFFKSRLFALCGPLHFASPLYVFLSVVCCVLIEIDHNFCGATAAAASVASFNRFPFGEALEF